MKYLSILVLNLLLALPVFANCDDPVEDLANVFGSKTSAVQSAAQYLENKGLDVRIRTVPTSSNLDITEKEFERNCLSWQSANGQRKSTLLVLMVATESRKLGLYYGGSLSNALDNHWNRIKQDYMVPAFHGGNYAEGFIAASQALGRRIESFQSEAVIPATVTTVNQAADLSGLWTFMKWFLLLIAVVSCVGFVVVALVRRKKEREKLEAEQNYAVGTRNKVIAKITDLENDSLTGWNKTRLEEISQDFYNLSKYSKNDPTVNGLSLATYQYIGREYERLFQDLSEINRSVIGKVSKTTPIAEVKPVVTAEQPAAKAATVSERAHSSHVVAPIIVNDSFNSGYYSETKRSRSSSDDDSWSSSSKSNNDDDSRSGGGSSSWGSSDSWGGGGSSSFGGDSGGGGGSSDF